MPIADINDPNLMNQMKGQKACIGCILLQETFEEAKLVALQLEAERLKIPFVALVWHKLIIPEDAFQSNVIIIRVGNRPFQVEMDEMEVKIKEWHEHAGRTHATK